MRTGRSLTVCCSLLPGGGVVFCSGKGCLLLGVLLGGGVPGSGGVPGPGGYPSMHWGRHPSPAPPVDRQTLVKILPWPNFVAAGKNYEKLIYLFCGEHSYTSTLLHSFTPAQLILEALSTSWTRIYFRSFDGEMKRNVLVARLIISTAFTFCSLPSHPIGTEQSHLPVQVKYTAVPLMFTWLEKIVCLCGHNCLKKLNILIIWCFLYWQKTSNFLLNFDKSKILIQPFQLCLYVSKRHAGFSHTHRNANIGIFVFTAWKQKIQWQNVTPSGNRTQASHNLWFQVQHSFLHSFLHS